jgi:hypothetical protein
MAGNITLKYPVTTVTLTTTNLQSLASSASKTVGWTSGTITNNSNNYNDYLLSMEFKAGTSPTASTGWQVWVYAAQQDTPTWGTIFSSGTAGAEGTATCFGSTATNVRDAHMRPLIYATVDATTSRLTGFDQIGIAQLFGGGIPSQFALFVSQDTGATSASSGNVAYYNPIISQYT